MTRFGLTMTVLLRVRAGAFFAFEALDRAFAARANLRRAASCFADGALLLRRFLLATFRDARFVVVFFIVLCKIRAVFGAFHSKR